MDSSLIEVLREAGRETQVLNAGEGSEILVLPYGGRILGLYAPRDERNFLWTNPALKTPDAARSFYASDEWKNSGGDRTWLGPEIEFFFPRYPELTPYHQPPAFDPGSYRVESSGAHFSMAMDFSVTPKSSGQPLRLKLKKSLRGAANPIPVAEDVQYAGYELEIVLESQDLLPIGIGIWNLLQLPPNGEMMIPTYGPCEPLVVFGQPPSEHLKITGHTLRYRMTAEGDHKISLPALSSTGRAGYFYEDGADAHLVVRNFFVNPSGDYVDASWVDSSDRGYGVQACSVHGEYGFFSELEYHAPAMTAVRPQSRDISQVWAYRGSRARIESIARRLLGAAPT